MIDINTINEEIKALEEKDTNYNNVQKLAWLYIVRDHLAGPSGVAAATGPGIPTPEMGSSDFMNTVSGKDPSAVWQVIDELASSVQLIAPKMYEATLDKIRAIP